MQKHQGFVGWGMGIACAALLVGSTALAQDPGVASTLEREASATPEEILAFTRDANEEANAIVKAITRLNETAKQSKAGGAECVQDNLNAVRNLAQISGMAEGTIQSALAAGQTERAEHEFRKVAVVLKKSRQLQAEAERCALGDGVQDGRTRVKVDGAPTDGVDETRNIPADIMDYGFDPPDASPF